MSQEHFKESQKPGATRFNRLRRIVPFELGGGVSLERIASIGILRQFQNRVGLVSAPIGGDIDDMARKHMRAAAHRLVEADAVNTETLVEVRPLGSAAAFQGGLGKSALTAVQVVKDALRADGMNAIPNSHPVMPVDRLDGKPIDDDEVWATIGGQLDSLNHQARGEKGVRKASLIMVADPEFVGELFAPQLIDGARFTDDHAPFVLSHVGDEPRDHEFAAA